MRAILLVPSPEWRDRLLADGPCGARPPVMWRNAPSDPGPSWGGPLRGNRVTEWTDPTVVRPPGAYPGQHGDMYVYQQERALVLAFDGAVVREGRDRAAYVLAGREGVDGSNGLTWALRDLGSADVWLLGSAAPGDEGLFLCGEAHGRLGAALASPPADAGDLLPCWALATVCAARGLGSVVVLG